MNLAAQTASILYESEPPRLGPQLDHLGRLSATALDQIQALIAELRPDEVLPGGLAMALRRDLSERTLPESISVSVEVDGEAPLGVGEEHALFSIAREAVNNVVKHAQASRAQIRLHLHESPWMEVQDDGRGFDAKAGVPSGRMGLAGMRERAEEIGWDLDLRSSPVGGTLLRVARRRREDSPR
jgi:signal transduction histidine kinase